MLPRMCLTVLSCQHGFAHRPETGGGHRPAPAERGGARRPHPAPYRQGAERPGPRAVLALQEQAGAAGRDGHRDVPADEVAAAFAGRPGGGRSRPHLAGHPAHLRPRAAPGTARLPRRRQGLQRYAADRREPRRADGPAAGPAHRGRLHAGGGGQGLVDRLQLHHRAGDRGAVDPSRPGGSRGPRSGLRPRGRARRLGESHPLAAAAGWEMFGDVEAGFEAGLRIIVAGVEATTSGGRPRSA